ncbi:hypothetical protein H5410_047542, partial [Solanum commersonii]
AYAPHVGLDEDIKKHFWEDLDEIVRVYRTSRRYSLAKISMATLGQPIVALTMCMEALEDHLVTFRSAAAKTQIDYLLLRKGDRGF